MPSCKRCNHRQASKKEGGLEPQWRHQTEVNNDQDDDAKSLAENERLMELSESPEEFRKHLARLKLEGGVEEDEDEKVMRKKFETSSLRQLKMKRRRKTSGQEQGILLLTEPPPPSTSMSSATSASTSTASQKRRVMLQQRKQSNNKPRREALEMRVMGASLVALAEGDAGWRETLEVVRARREQFNKGLNVELGLQAFASDRRINDRFRRRIRRKCLARRAVEFICACFRDNDTYY